MKKIVLLTFLFIGFVASAQNEKGASGEIITVEKEEKPECIIWPLKIKSVPMVFNADAYYRSQIKQPWVSAGCAYQDPVKALSKDRPFIHTINGSVYTFDYLRYQVR